MAILSCVDPIQTPLVDIIKGFLRIPDLHILTKEKRLSQFLETKLLRLLANQSLKVFSIK